VLENAGNPANGVRVTRGRFFVHFPPDFLLIYIVKKRPKVAQSKCILWYLKTFCEKITQIWGFVF
jgi:hypothetical protein